MRNQDVIQHAGIEEEDFAAACRSEFAEIERRRRLYLGSRERVEIAGCTAIVIDDGIATGATTRAALRATRLRHPNHLVLAVPVAVWWRIGDRYSTLYPSPISSSVIRPFPVSPAAERAAGRGAVLAAVVAATWLTWASLRHEFDLRWWSVLGPLLLAGILAGFGWRVLTARMAGANIGAGCLILSGGPVVAALLAWVVTRSLTLL